MSNNRDTTGLQLRDDVFVSIALPDRLARMQAKDYALVTLSITDITKDRMADLHNTRIGCELFAGKDDAFGIISALSAAGVTGHLTVIAPPLPDPTMVERELQKVAGKISVTLIQL